MSTTFSIFSEIKKCCEAKEWDRIITLCGQLKQEERLTTEELLYTHEYIKLYAMFAKNEFTYSDDLHYADSLTQSAHLAYTFPHLRFLCSFIMICGLRAGAKNIYLDENDYTIPMMEATYGMDIDFEETIKDKAKLFAALYPCFNFLERLALTNNPDAPIVNMDGFRVEGGVLLQYTGKDSIVNVPEGVLAIGEGAFSNVKQPIHEVTLPEGVTHIGNYAFFDSEHNQSRFCARNLKKVNTPSTLKCIGEAAFMQCSALEEMDISMVEELGNNAFKWCGSLKRANLSSLKKIGSAVFWTCREIEEITNYQIGNSIPPQTFRDCHTLREFNIPESVTKIGSLAFSGCNSLKALDISRIEEFGTYAFSSCNNLEKIELSPKVEEIPAYAFSYCEKLEDFDLPPALKFIGREAFNSCQSLKAIHIPDTVIAMNSFSFACCTSLEEVSISANVEVIEESAFISCKNLKSLKLPEKLVMIQDSAFEDCEQLEDFVLPKTVKVLGKSAFKNCKKLTFLDLRHVQKIGANCFSNTKSLARVVLTSSAEVHAKAFSGNKKLQIEFID